MRYDKNEIEIEAIKSVQNGRITEKLGVFILQRAKEIIESEYNPHHSEYRQALIDYAVMKVCEEFLERYKSGRCAANLIIGMIHSRSIDRVRATKWKDVYGENNRTYLSYIDGNGERKRSLVGSNKDENISYFVSGFSNNRRMD